MLVNAFEILDPSPQGPLTPFRLYYDIEMEHEEFFRNKSHVAKLLCMDKIWSATYSLLLWFAKSDLIPHEIFCKICCKVDSRMEVSPNPRWLLEKLESTHKGVGISVRFLWRVWVRVYFAHSISMAHKDFQIQNHNKRNIRFLTIAQQYFYMIWMWAHLRREI